MKRGRILFRDSSADNSSFLLLPWDISWEYITHEIAENDFYFLQGYTLLETDSLIYIMCLFANWQFSFFCDLKQCIKIQLQEMKKIER